VEKTKFEIKKIVRTDLNYLKTMSGGDPDLMTEMIEIFTLQVAELAEEMEELFNVQDFKSLGKLAHKAKTSVAIMGMNNLAGELKQFELNAKDGIKTETYRVHIDNFKLETQEAVRELIEFKTSLQ